MRTLQPLDGETTSWRGSPHFMSFLPFFSPWLGLLVWGLAFPTLWPSWPSGFKFVAWLGVGILILVATAYFALRAAYLAGGFGLLAAIVSSQSFGWNSPPILAAEVAAIGALGIIGTEFWRRSHIYCLTNYRISVKSGVVKRRERSIRYNAISDLHVQQGLLGQLAGYASIVPVTNSGLGLGSDFAMAGAAFNLQRLRRSLPFTLGGGGGHSRNAAKVAPGDCLFGVRPAEGVHHFIEARIHEHSPIAHSINQVSALGRIERLLQQRMQQ